jgi:hypothetical protein
MKLTKHRIVALLTFFAMAVCILIGDVPYVNVLPNNDVAAEPGDTPSDPRIPRVNFRDAATENRIEGGIRTSGFTLLLNASGLGCG